MKLLPDDLYGRLLMQSRGSGFDETAALLRELKDAPEYVQTRMTPELWSKLHLALGCAREYPEFDGGSPIRTMLDDALAELDKLEGAMRASISGGRS